MRQQTDSSGAKRRSLAGSASPHGHGCGKVIFSISRFFRFCIDCNVCAKCQFLIVLGANESLDIDLFESFEILKKYSLISEIQPLKVGYILENLVWIPDFPKCVQLRRAVSPSSVNIFTKFQKILKGLCLNFTTSLKRSKTGTWRKSYSRFKIGNFRKIAFTPPHTG